MKWFACLLLLASVALADDIPPPPGYTPPNGLDPASIPALEQPKDEKPVLKQLRTWEAAQAKLGAKWLAKNEPSKKHAEYQTVESIPNALVFDALPGKASKTDYYIFPPSAYCYSPRHGGFVNGFDYDYLDWLKRQGVTFWRFVPKKVCDEYGCRTLGYTWQQFEP